MKTLSRIFATLSILLTNTMCIVVTNLCTSSYYQGKYGLTSAPWEVGLLFTIPFAIGIVACSVVAYIAKKKVK